MPPKKRKKDPKDFAKEIINLPESERVEQIQALFRRAKNKKSRVFIVKVLGFLTEGKMRDYH